MTNTTIKNAAILAGGKGNRLNLEDMPKPMTYLGDKYLLEHTIFNLRASGIKIYIYCIGDVVEKK